LKLRFNDLNILDVQVATFALRSPCVGVRGLGVPFTPKQGCKVQGICRCLAADPGIVYGGRVAMTQRRAIQTAQGKVPNLTCLGLGHASWLHGGTNLE
jgi:hypothetical protein